MQRQLIVQYYLTFAFFLNCLRRLSLYSMYHMTFSTYTVLYFMIFYCNEGLPLLPLEKGEDGEVLYYCPGYVL